MSKNGTLMDSLFLSIRPYVTAIFLWNTYLSYTTYRDKTWDNWKTINKRWTYILFYLFSNKDNNAMKHETGKS